MRTELLLTSLLTLALAGCAQIPEKRIDLIYQVPVFTDPVNGQPLAPAAITVTLIGADGKVAAYTLPETEQIPVERGWMGTVKLVYHPPAWDGRAGDLTCPELPEGSPLACWLKLWLPRAAILNPITMEPLSEIRVWHDIGDGSREPYALYQPDGESAIWVGLHMPRQSVIVEFRVSVSDWQ